MRIVNWIAVLIMAVGSLISYAPCHADGGTNYPIEFKGELVQPLSDTQPIVVEQNDGTTITSTGKRWIDDDGNELWQYQAKIQEVEAYTSAIRWNQISPMTFQINQGVLSSIVAGTTAQITIADESLIWTPTVTVGGHVYYPSGNPIIIDDFLDNNYKQNVLQWDYGICKRYMRTTGGMVAEMFIFNSNPNGDIVIDLGVDPSSNMDTGDVYAYDANYKTIPVVQNGNTKTITRDSLVGMSFPITVDPTKKVYGNIGGGYYGETYFDATATASSAVVYNDMCNWSQLWNGSIGTISVASANPIKTGIYNYRYDYAYYHYNQ